MVERSDDSSSARSTRSIRFTIAQMLPGFFRSCKGFAREISSSSRLTISVNYLDVLRPLGEVFHSVRVCEGDVATADFVRANDVFVRRRTFDGRSADSADRCTEL